MSTYLMATESNALSIGGGSCSSYSATRLATSSLATAFGCTLRTTYSSNLIVKLCDLRKICSSYGSSSCCNTHTWTGCSCNSHSYTACSCNSHTTTSCSCNSHSTTSCSCNSHTTTYCSGKTTAWTTTKTEFGTMYTCSSNSKVVGAYVSSVGISYCLGYTISNNGTTTVVCACRGEVYSGATGQADSCSTVTVCACYSVLTQTYTCSCNSGVCDCNSGNGCSNGCSCNSGNGCNNGCSCNSGNGCSNGCSCNSGNGCNNGCSCDSGNGCSNALASCTSVCSSDCSSNGVY